MAAPAEKTIRDLNGKWKLNKDVSTDPDAALALQNIAWLVRMTVKNVSITIDVKQFDGPPTPAEGQPEPAVDPVTHFNLVQIASGLKGSTEERCLDWLPRRFSNWVWGNVEARAKWISPEELKGVINKEHGEWLTEGWDEDKEYMYIYIVNSEVGWTAAQIWGFQQVAGQRQLARKVFLKKGDKTETVLSIWDFVA